MLEFQENYTAPRIVLAASGVEHEELLSIAEPLLSDLPSVPLVGEPTSQYVGGEYRAQGDTKVCSTVHSRVGSPFLYIFLIVLLSKEKSFSCIVHFC